MLAKIKSRPYFFSFILCAIIFLGVYSYLSSLNVDYRIYENGKYIILDTGRLGKKYFPLGQTNQEMLSRLDQARKNTLLSNDERNYAEYMYYVNNDTIPQDERLEFFAKMSIDRTLTDNMRAMAIYYILQMVKHNPEKLDHFKTILSTINPYEGVLSPFKNYQDWILGLNKFCYGAYRYAPCVYETSLIESKKYVTEKDPIKQSNIKKDFNLFTALTATGTVNFLQNPTALVIYRLSYVEFLNSLIQNVKNGIINQIPELYLSDIEYLSDPSLKPGKSYGSISEDREANTFEAYRYYTLVNYYLYKKDIPSAKTYYAILKEKMTQDNDLKYLVENTNFFKADFDYFQKNLNN